MEQNDDAQIEEIVGRLERRYTREQISSADLTSRVRRFYRDFSTARIRSFVGIFVERLVRQSIESPASNPQASPPPATSMSPPRNALLSVLPPVGRSR